MSSKTTKAEETEDKFEPDEQQSPELGESADNSSSDKISLEQEVEELQAKVKEYWDQIMLLQADMDNYRKRAARDVENAHKYGLKGFIEELLPVVDSMEMGLNAATSENATLESIREGSELTMQMFIQVLEKQGLNQIDPLGEKFDPEQHQAIGMVDDDTVESNTVVNVMQKGFALNDRLVRPAMVMVAK
jgi:molecular chaperone GrpE